MGNPTFYYHACDLSRLGDLTAFTSPSGETVTALQGSLEPAYRADNEDVVYIVQPSWTDEYSLVLDSDFVPLDEWGHKYEEWNVNDLDYSVLDEEELEEREWSSESYLRDFLHMSKYVQHLAAKRLAEYHKWSFCHDCEDSTKNEYYMVHDFLWAQTGLGYEDGMLCIGCLEKRLGSTLTWEDFTTAPVNWAFGSTHRSVRLMERLVNDEGYSRTDLWCRTDIPASWRIRSDFADD